MYKKYTKRIIDLALSILLITIFLPLGVLLAILIKLNSVGPIIFKQQRTGRNGSTFYMYKFRTMTCDNDVMDSKSPNKITSLGKIIRSLSLDELPQLINVIKGDMSLIGPRPWIPEYYKHMTTDQKKRNSIRPGITGLAQIKGRNSISVLEKIDYDLTYINNISIKNDFMLMLFTFMTIFTRKGTAIEKKAIHEEIALLQSLQNSQNINELVYDISKINTSNQEKMVNLA